MGSKVMTMYTMFGGVTLFNQDLSDWDVSSVEDMDFIFYEAEPFNNPLSTWTVSKVMTMRAMFYKANLFNQDLSDWDVSSVEDMRFAFYGTSSFNKNLCMWGPKFIQTPSVEEMFQYSDCPTLSDPILDISPVSPLCWVCIASLAPSASQSPSVFAKPSHSPSMK